MAEDTEIAQPVSVLERLPMRDEDGEIRTSFVEEIARAIHAADTPFLRAVVGFERRDQIAEIGLVELRDDGAQRGRVGNLYRARDFFDELAANFAIFVAHRETHRRRIGGIGNVHVIGHAAPRRFDTIAQLV